MIPYTMTFFLLRQQIVILSIIFNQRWLMLVKNLYSCFECHIVKCESVKILGYKQMIYQTKILHIF